MRLAPLLQKAKCALDTLSLTDKFLLIFMLILMIQSAHNLFSPELVLTESNSFDTVIRTTAAAIFGYFISANFQNGTPDTSKNADGETLTRGSACPDDGQEPQRRNYLQISIVAGIGITSLLLLMIAHNYFEATSATVATISQLRDFISGSVGFLIGHSPHPPKAT